MKKGYWVSQVVDIKDQELFQKYFDATAHLVERGDYRMICGGPAHKTLEAYENLSPKPLRWDPK